QTGHRGTVSNTGLGISIRHAPGRQYLPLQPVELVGVGASADPGDARRTVDRLALSVLGDERAVARVLDVLGDAGDRVVPRDVFPVIAAGATDLRLGQPVGVVDVALERGALGAQATPTDRMIRIAFDVHDRRGHILRAVAQRVDDDAARHGAIRAGAS